MKNNKTMLRKLLFILTISPLFFGCTSDINEDNVITAKGGVRYGGEFRFMSSEKVESLFPLATTDIYGARIVSQIFEGLLKIDPASTDLIPGIAKETHIDEDLKVYTFKLRDDVFFHDDACFPEGKGRKVTAHDFKYSLEFACSNDELNQLPFLLKDKISGADSYYKGEASEVEGIKVIDDYTLVIELKSPFSVFEKVLTHSSLGVFPKEAMDKYGKEIYAHPVGTGAFVLDEMVEDKIVLARNNKYWDKDDFGNPLPFLDKITMTYSQNKTDELLSFRAEKIDLVMDIPVEEVQNVLGTLPEAQAGANIKHKVDSKTSMSITYYGFATKEGLFADKNIRKAFNMAIDRKKIIDNWLEGEGWPIVHGFVPKMKNYPIEKVKGFSYDVEKAQELLAKAGYPGGKDFPEIKLYINALDGSGQHILGKAVATSLKNNLGIDVTIELVTFMEREELVSSGDAIFWKAGWVADYPDAENFLSLFYGGNIGEKNASMNPFNYNNPVFNGMYEKALVETDETKRNELFAKCDQLVIDDAVVMPLINDDFITMVNMKVRKFVTNEMEQLDFSRIFIKELNTSINK